MLVLILLYSSVLGEVRTSQEELNGIYVVSAYVAGFVFCAGLTAWALNPKRPTSPPKWFVLSQTGAVLMALGATIFISNLA